MTKIPLVYLSRQHLTAEFNGKVNGGTNLSNG